MTYIEVVNLIRHCLLYNRPVMIWGAPGIGKTYIVDELSVELEMPMTQWRAAQMEGVDLRGIPTVENGFTVFHPPIEFNFPDPNGKYLWFFDDINLSAVADDFRAAMFQLLDPTHRGIGRVRLPDGCRIAAACNPVEYNLLAVELPIPLLNRFVHVWLPIPTSQEWVTNFAVPKSVNEQIIAYHLSGVAGDGLYRYTPGESVIAFPTPRSWTMLSDLIRDVRDTSRIRGLAEGSVGPAEAAKLLAYIDVIGTLKPLETYLRHADTESLPSKVSTLWALCVTIALNVPRNEADAAMRLLSRISTEAQSPELALFVIQLLHKRWKGLPMEVLATYGSFLSRFIPWLS